MLFRSEPMAGKTYSLRIYGNSVSGNPLALLCDFNPNLWTSGTTWAASTGEVWTINNAVGANKPAQIVDRSSLLFDGVAHYLKTAAFTLNQPLTVYLVARQITSVLNATLYDGMTSNSGRLYTSTTTPNTLLAYAGNPGPSVSPTVGNYCVTANVINGASSSLSLDAGSASLGNSGSSAPGGFSLGGNSAGVTPSNIQVLALVAYSVAHDASTQTKVYNFLKARSGI